MEIRGIIPVLKLSFYVALCQKPSGKAESHTSVKVAVFYVLGIYKVDYFSCKKNIYRAIIYSGVNCGPLTY